MVAFSIDAVISESKKCVPQPGARATDDRQYEQKQKTAEQKAKADYQRLFKKKLEERSRWELAARRKESEQRAMRLRERQELVQGQARDTKSSLSAWQALETTQGSWSPLGLRSSRSASPTSSFRSQSLPALRSNPDWLTQRLFAAIYELEPDRDESEGEAEGFSAPAPMRAGPSHGTAVATPSAEGHE